MTWPWFISQDRGHNRSDREYLSSAGRLGKIRGSKGAHDGNISVLISAGSSI